MTRPAYLSRHPGGDLVNGWPGGPRVLACLGCDRPFRSRARDHRLCPGCRTARALPPLGAKQGSRRRAPDG